MLSSYFTNRSKSDVFEILNNFFFSLILLRMLLIVVVILGHVNSSLSSEWVKIFGISYLSIKMTREIKQIGFLRDVKTATKTVLSVVMVVDDDGDDDNDNNNNISVNGIFSSSSLYQTKPVTFSLVPMLFHCDTNMLETIFRISLYLESL